VDKLAAQFSNKDIVWLTQQDIILNENTILSGIDGWYDCVNNIEKVNKSIVMRDWLRIQDYICDRSHIDISKERSEKSYKLSDKIIKNQSAGYKNQIIVTHVPPFAQLVKEKQGYEAYYTSCDFGNVLTSSCTTLNKTICLSGHTHNKADYQIDNIHCYTMEACRGKPALSGVLNVDKMEFHFL
jgi:hypothetical protein